MRKCYNNLVTTKQWPALTASIPEDNFSYIMKVPNEIDGRVKNQYGMKCHKYHSKYHLNKDSSEKKKTTNGTPKMDTFTASNGHFAKVE